jgi:hypothetical protein
MHTTGWSRGLEVSGGGQGVVSHAGLVLLRHLADKTGLTGGLSRALATPRFLVHDRGRVMADLACAVADGARVISDFRVMSDHVTELTGLLRCGPGGDQLRAWPAAMRVFARRERPHPGAQLTLFEAADGWRYSLWATNRPAATKGWLGQNAYIDAAHRVHARVEDAIRTGKTAESAISPPLTSGSTPRG